MGHMPGLQHFINFSGTYENQSVGRSSWPKSWLPRWGHFQKEHKLIPFKSERKDVLNPMDRKMLCSMCTTQHNNFSASGKATADLEA
jgi:hypothetical protein